MQIKKRGFIERRFKRLPISFETFLQVSFAIRHFSIRGRVRKKEKKKRRFTFEETTEIVWLIPLPKTVTTMFSQKQTMILRKVLFTLIDD